MYLKELLSLDGHPLKRKTATEYAGPCIFCGGEDRFIVQTNKGNRGRYWCRQCKKSGDAIQYLRDYKGMDYHSACRELALEPKNYKNVGEPIRMNTNWVPRQKEDPGAQWKMEGREFVKRCKNNLNGEYLSSVRFRPWEEQSKKIRHWLRDERGLNQETIEKAGLGWNPRDFYFDRKSWGLPEILNEKTGKPKSLWMPRGLLIPTYINDEVVNIKIRRFDLEDSEIKARYVKWTPCQDRFSRNLSYQNTPDILI